MGTIGERLKSERIRLGYTQEEFAEIAGVKKHSQIRYERDERSPDGYYFAKIAAIGIDAGYLITGTQTPAAAREASGDYDATPREQAVLDLFRALDEESQQEVLHIAQEKERLRKLEAEVEGLKAQMKGRRRA